MLTYTFQDTRSDSLYQQLYKYIRNDIISGRLKADEKLPSKRTFAKNLGVSVITIENAYDQLMGEGYIYSLSKKGFFVSDIGNASVKNELSVPDGDISVTEEETKEYIADFSSNRQPQAQFPFSVWSRLMRECISDYQESLLDKTPGEGSVELRKAIADHLKDFRGMDVDYSQIVIGAGTENLYIQIVQLLGMDLIYGVEDPGFLTLSQIYKVSGAEVKYISLDDNGISIEELERTDVNIAHISPSHQFPTGRITPISRRYELLGWASKKESRYIIEDDYDSEFRMTGKPVATMKSIDVNDKVIYMNTFSKSISNSLRVSYMILPKHLMQLYKHKLSFYSCPVTSIIQLTLARFIGEGYFEKHINRTRTYYRKLRDYLVESLLHSRIAEYINIKEADSGLHLLLHINISCSDKELCMMMERRNIKVCAVSEYSYTREEKYNHDFLMNYSSLSLEQIDKAVNILNEVVCYLAKTDNDVL